MFGLFSKNSYFINRNSSNKIELNFPHFFIFKFDDFDSFSAFFNFLIFSVLKNKLNFLLNYFELFKYKNSYFFIIKKVNLYYDYFYFIFFNILEFTNSYYTSELLLRKIYEFGDLIFNYKNIHKFKKVFNKK